MTKLTDLKGAIETFIIDIDKVAVSNVHLEVDVEAMAEIIKNCDKTNVVKDGKWENYLSADEWVAKALSDTIPKWARLVRK